MHANFGISLTDFNTKQACNSSSTIDEESRHEEPYYYWEPCWMEIDEENKFTDALNICPGCSKIVSKDQQKLACQGVPGHFYLAHSSCVNDIFQFTEYTHLAKKVETKDIFTEIPYKIGCREFFVQVSIEHPLSATKLFYCSKKMLEFERKLNFSISQRKSEYLEPNCIVLPLKQFKCCIKISPLFASEQVRSHYIYFKVDLMKQHAGIHHMKVQDGGVIFMGEFEIIEDPNIKIQIIEDLNFKYKRPYLEESFVKFNIFSIQFKDNQVEPIMEMNRSSQRESQKSENQFTLQSHHKILPIVQLVGQQQKTTDKEFIDYIKTQMGSKQFQKKVKNYKHEQIESIIGKILPFLEEIILNDYANYMFQSLLGNCTFEQRMKIITKVADILTKLVCQQQGTFVFQQLIAFLTNREQFECICGPVARDLKLISLDGYGNHFMRKLIQNMPKQMLSLFMPNVYHNFAQFSKNKNAVCVMKCFLRALKQGQSLSTQLAQHLKRYLDLLTLNTQQLINDEYGNYLIQQAYEVVSAQKLGGISDYIVNFFSHCSCQKFSSNVVLNCIKKYWSPSSSSTVAIYRTLKQNLDNRNISYMYQNQQGNKILLEIMELPLDLSVKDKIGGAIRNEHPSKFNNRRWINMTGKSKTGAVGSNNNYTNFSQAHSFMKRKHYN